MLKNENMAEFTRAGFGSPREAKAPLVTMTYGDGKIQFNRAASRLLGITDGDRLRIGFDVRNPRRLWFARSEGREGFTVHRRVKGKEGESVFEGAHCVICRALVNHVRDVLGTSGNVKMQLASEMEDGAYWGLESSYSFYSKKASSKQTS